MHVSRCKICLKYDLEYGNPHAIIVLTGNIIHVWNINNQLSLVSLYRTSSLVKRWLEFPNHGIVIVTLITESRHWENDVMDKTQIIKSCN